MITTIRSTRVALLAILTGVAFAENEESMERTLAYGGKKAFDFGGGDPDPCHDRKLQRGGKKGGFNLHKYICPTPAPTAPTADATAPPSTAAVFECDGITNLCGAGQACFNGQCVTSGTARFSMSWTGDANIDFGLALPNGNIVSAMSSDPSSNAFFDPLPGDQDVSIENSNIYVESIYFTDTPESGLYALIADLQTEAVNNNIFTLSVFDGNNTVLQENFGLFFAGASEQEQVYFFTVP